MVMLGALLYGAMSAVCGLGRAVDNERTKINTRDESFAQNF